MNRDVSDAERSCRVARIAGGLGTFGLLADTIIDAHVVPPETARLVAIAVCAVLWLVTLSRRHRPSLAFGTAMFLAINATITFALTISAHRLASTGLDWVPFRARQLGAMTIALLAPPPTWVGVVAIMTIIGSAVVQYELFSPEVQAQLPYGDPWSSIFFGAFALVLLVYRRRADAKERELVRAHAEAESYQRYARAMLALRDLANTPLQTLTNIVELLRSRSPRPDETVERLARTVGRLTEFERATRPFEDELEWQPGDEAWDPRAILRGTRERP